jgi:hypothetical protein
MDRRNQLYRNFELSRRYDDMIRYLIECNRVGSLTIPIENLSLWLIGDYDSKPIDTIRYRKHLDILEFLYDDFVEFVFSDTNKPTSNYSIHNSPSDKIKYRRASALYRARVAVLEHILRPFAGVDLVHLCLEVFQNRDETSFTYEQIEGQCYQLITFPPNSDWLLPMHEFIQSLDQEVLSLYHSPHSQYDETREQFDSRSYRNMILGTTRFCDKNFKETFFDFINNFLLGEINFNNIEINTSFLERVISFERCKLLAPSFKKLALEILETGFVPERYQTYSYYEARFLYHILYSLRLMGEIKFIKSVGEDLSNFRMSGWEREFFEELYENLDDKHWEDEECPWERSDNEEQEWNDAYGDGF